jgi:hypothetical protein
MVCENAHAAASGQIFLRNLLQRVELFMEVGTGTESAAGAADGGDEAASVNLRACAAALTLWRASREASRKDASLLAKWKALLPSGYRC